MEFYTHLRAEMSWVETPEGLRPHTNRYFVKEMPDDDEIELPADEFDDALNNIRRHSQPTFVEVR